MSKKHLKYPLVSFAGFQRSGKSTCCAFLQEELGAEVYPFAKALKVSARILFGLTEEQVYTQEGKKSTVTIPEYEEARIERGLSEIFGEVTPDLLETYKAQSWPIFEGKTMTVREVLQKHGTEAMRDVFGIDVWTRMLKARVLEGDKLIVNDDCRFENESALVRELGGVIIGIRREGCAPDGHPSEQTLAENWDTMTDVTIVNDGSLEDLFAKVREVLFEDSSVPRLKRVVVRDLVQGDMLLEERVGKVVAITPPNEKARTQYTKVEGEAGTLWMSGDKPVLVYTTRVGVLECTEPDPEPFPRNSPVSLPCD